MATLRDRTVTDLASLIHSDIIAFTNKSYSFKEMRFDYYMETGVYSAAHTQKQKIQSPLSRSVQSNGGERACRHGTRAKNTGSGEPSDGELQGWVTGRFVTETGS